MAGMIKLIIAGQPKNLTALERMKKKVHVRMLKVSLDAQIEETRFAGARVAITWTGTMLEIKDVDYLYQAAVRYGDQNMVQWEIGLSFSYGESEGD